MDKLREEFEDAWIADNSSTSEEAEIRREALRKTWHINESGEGAYFDSFVMWAWKWWQASRASIVVELPAIIEQIIPGEYHEGKALGYESAIESCKELIRSIGLSIKGE